MGTVEKREPHSSVALVTGATGFVGSHLVRALKNKDYEVLIYSRQPYRNGNRLNISEDSWITGELDDLNKLAQAFENVDVVFHLAGIAHTRSYRPSAYDDVNSKGTKNIYTACLEARVRHFVFFSSILASVPDQSEYSKSKRNAEDFLMSFNRSPAQTGVTVLRPANVYGVGMKGGLSNFIRYARLKIVPKLPELSSTFSLVSVDDLCAAAMDVVENYKESYESLIWTITDGEEYTASRIEEAVYGAMGWHGPRWRISKYGFHQVCRAAYLADRLKIFRNDLGPRLYSRLAGDDQLGDGMAPRYSLSPTCTLESAMPRILSSF